MANKIVFGGYTFEGSNILTGDAVFEHSMIGETLTVDTLSIGVYSETDITKTEYGTPLYYYQDNSIWGMFYVNYIERTSKNTYSIDCFSIIGILANARHYGGMYNGVAASVVLADILSGVQYTLDAELANTTVRGYLPIASKRDNLQQLLFAINAAVKIAADGKMSIEQMHPNTVSRIDTSRCYMGGSVVVGDTVDGVQLTEHNYFISNEEVTVFEDSIIGQETVTFSEPYHSLTITGGRIISSGVNFCVIAPPSGSTAASVTVKGKKYTHVTRVVSVGNTSSSSANNVKTVAGAYLANPEIADTLATRVYNYLSCNKRIKEAVIVDSERPSDVVEIWNPYDEEYVEACMESMNIALSGINKGECEFLVGYTPEGVISGYQHYAMMTGAATWQKSSNNMSITPTDGTLIIDGVEKSGTQSLGNVDKFRMILVGGGGGGGNGESGANASDASVSFTRYSTWNSQGSGYHVKDVSYSPGVGGAGGRGGVGGQGGKVFELSITPQNGDSGAISIGGGGSGGSTPSAGAESTLSVNSVAYSSGMGKLYPYGYVEPKTGLTVAICGTGGISGASGGNGGAGGQGDVQGNGYNGESTSLFSGGNGASKHNEYQSKGDRGPYYHWYYGGGGGGGASGKAVGGNGSSYNGGNGANGGNAPATTHYGEGGCGGYGGGGGGGAAMMYYDKNSLSSWDANCYTGTSGQGGSGGDGASGKGGVIFIYY